LELDGIHQLLVDADCINIWSENINTIREATDVLLQISREVGLKVNAENTKYMVMSHLQNAGHCHNSLIANKSFESLEKFRNFGKTVKNKKCIL
jgi:hypothetical protein